MTLDLLLVALFALVGLSGCVPIQSTDTDESASTGAAVRLAPGADFTLKSADDNSKYDWQCTRTSTTYTHCNYTVAISASNAMATRFTNWANTNTNGPNSNGLPGGVEGNEVDIALATADISFTDANGQWVDYSDPAKGGTLVGMVYCKFSAGQWNCSTIRYPSFEKGESQGFSGIASAGWQGAVRVSWQKQISSHTSGSAPYVGWNDYLSWDDLVAGIPGEADLHLEFTWQAVSDAAAAAFQNQ